MVDDIYTSSPATTWESSTLASEPGHYAIHQHPPSSDSLNNTNAYNGRPSFQSLDSVEEDPSQDGRTGSGSSAQLRSSGDSSTNYDHNGNGNAKTGQTLFNGPPPSSLQPWRDSHSAAFMDTLSSINTGQPPSLVEPTFDENVLRALCELDCGVPLLLDRIKQGIVSCREASTFFKKRALIEDEYGKTLQKLARSTSETYSLGDGKAGSFVSAWQTSMRIHESMAENRIRFAQRLNEMSEELSNLVKEVDKNRKQTKDLASRYERALQESETLTEKCKNRLDFTSEELERVLLQKEGESFKDTGMQGRLGGGGGNGGKRAIGKAVAKGGMLLKGKNPGNIQRQEGDIRSRLSTASDQYRKAMTETQAMRQEYFNFQLPRILRALKECADEIDLGTQYHLTRYAFLFESIVLSDGQTLVPPATEDGINLNIGLKATIETIDNRADFKTYMQNYAFARGNAPSKGPRREGPADEGFLPPLPTFTLDKHAQYIPPTPSTVISNGLHGHHHPQHAQHGGHNQHQQHNGIQDRGRPTFSIDLAEQMVRDNVEVPPIVVKCCEAIERHGIRNQGIYRVSGIASKVATLKGLLDKDLESVDLDAPEWSGDINNVTSVLKMWLRDLPDPLMTTLLHQGFIEAAKIENDRLRHIRLHERVNELPDPNYATLKYFLGHLHRINQHSADNSMSMQNLAIVFGPTLFGQQNALINSQGQGGVMADQSLQNTAIETILNHYTDIFIDESEAT